MTMLRNSDPLPVARINLSRTRRIRHCIAQMEIVQFLQTPVGTTVMLVFACLHAVYYRDQPVLWCFNLVLLLYFGSKLGGQLRTLRRALAATDSSQKDETAADERIEKP